MIKQTTYNSSGNRSLPLREVRRVFRKVFFLFIMLLMGVGSAWGQTASVWDGTKPTETWDAANRTAAGITGAGTEADPYVIKDAKGFVYFWWAANNGSLNSSTQYWTLDADIDLDNRTWPYVNKNGNFKGKFDGQNHTISNIKLEPATANYNYGLFCVIQGANATNHAEVKNLTISNTTIAPSADFGKTTSIGILAGKADSNVDITNVTISGTSSITYAKKINDENYIGGLLGQITGANTTVTNCHVSSLTMTAKNTTTNAYFAGLIGRINAQGTVTNCSTTDVTINYELIANASRLAGLVGNSKGTNNGTPTVITGCTATRTKINLPKGINNGCYIGAFIGQVNSNQQQLTNNTVDSPEIAIGTDIKAASYIGGAIGDFSGSSADYMGSLTGLTVTSPSVTVDKNSIDNSYIGAVFGRINTYSTIDDVDVSDPTLTYKNTGAPSYALNLGSFAGGIFGAAAQETAVTNIDVTGDATVTIGFNNNVQKIKAGLIGQSTTNVRLEGWTIENTTVDVKGSLATAAGQLGGFIGYIKSAADAPINVKDIDITGTSTVSVSGNVSIGYQLGGFVGYIETVANGDVKFSNTKITGNSSVTVAGTISATSHIGGFAGQFATGNQANHLLTIDGAGVEGTSTVSLGGNMTTASSYFGGFVGLVQGRSQVNNIIKIANVTNGTSNITITGTVQDKSGYFGGLAGYVTQGIQINSWTLKTAANIALNGNVTVASYVGGAIGDFTAVSGYTSSIDGLNVSKPVVTINKVSVKDCFMGGVFGRVGNYVSVANASSESPTLTYNNKDNQNVVLNLGSFAGGIIGVATAATAVTDVTVTGEAKVTIGTGTSNISNIKAGLIGNASVSARLNKWTVEKTTVHIKGALATTTSYFGGFVGNMTGGDVLSVNTVNINKVDLTVDGNIGIASYLGGFAGMATSNCQLNDMHIKEEVKLNFGATINTSSYLGGGFGNLAGAAALPTSASKISVTNPTIVLGVIAPAMYVGGLAGQVTTNCSLDDWTANTPIITLNQPIKTASYIGGGIGNFVGSANLSSIASGIKVNNAKVTIAGVGVKDVCIGNMFGRIQTYSTIENSTSTNSTLTFNGDIALNLHLGDVAGYVTGAVTQLKNVTSKNAKIAINGNVTANSLYLGALTGYQTLSDIRESTVDGADIALNGNNASNMYIGGAVGYMNPTAAPITTLEQVVVKNSNIHTVGSHTYAKNNKALVVGGVAGYVGHTNATTLAEVNKCVTENIDINLSGFIPEAANTSGSLYNQQQNAFVIGGVIGRINTPYSLPEHLYFSGKIYAPFAAVGPVIGVFYNNVGAATYLYDDYSGENASKLPAGEWDKADTWYFSNYQLGLSPEVLNQTDRTKNFTAATTNIDGVEYLTIEEGTLTNSNTIGAAQKNSRTILAYTATGDIVPAWNSGGFTYPAYYMYYMQGVNRATFNDEIDIEKVLIGFAFAPLLNRTGNDESGYVFTVDLNGFDPGTDYTITYQWYKSDKTTAIAGATSSSLSISKDDLDAAGGSVYCVVTASADGIDPFNVTLQGSYKIVVFVNASSGVDNIAGSRTRGWTPTTAVKTLDNANLLLYSPEEGGTIDNNYIVIIGTLSEIQSSGKNPATLTGVWEGTDYKGIIKLRQINPGAGENAVNPANQPGKKGSNCYVLADTKFEYLTFQANSNTEGNNFIECHGNDVWFGKGLSMTGFRNLGEDHGNLEMAQNIPELSIILTATNLSEEDIRKYTNRTKPQVVTFESGRYGRILGGRYTSGFFNSVDNTSHAILGSHDHPIWAVVNVNIDKENPNKGTVNRHEEPNKGTVTDNFTCDINCIVAGLTDGSMYGDYTINVHGGKIGYIVGGNQGNPVPNGSKNFTQPDGNTGDWGQWPNASYLGRTVINVEQDSELANIEIDNLYAGGLGRRANGDKATSVVDMYMYGHTEINMKSGTVLGNVYGGGAGGVIGLNPWDMHVPYATTDADNASNAIMNGVQYGEWGAKKAGSPLANVTLHDSDGNDGYTTKPLNLGESYTTLNVSGGTINGSVYGGGCGFVSNMPEQVVVQGVGSIFGNSNVNISGGKILGSVYGGSEGSDKYYEATNKYGQTITHIAEMNGTVTLKITGTDELYPTIGGNIYGAGKGIKSNGAKEYLRIATAGNVELGGEDPDKYKTDITVLIDLPDDYPFTGNIYGGGQMGAVDGTTKVIIKGGIIEGDVFGAGMGEPGHPDKAKVTGNTNVIVDSGWTEP